MRHRHNRPETPESIPVVQGTMARELLYGIYALVSEVGGGGVHPVNGSQMKIQMRCCKKTGPRRECAGHTGAHGI